MTDGPKGGSGDSDGRGDRGDLYDEFDVESDDPLEAAFQDQIPTSYETPGGQPPELTPIPNDIAPSFSIPSPNDPRLTGGGNQDGAFPPYQEDNVSTSTHDPERDGPRPIESFQPFDEQDEINTAYLPANKERPEDVLADLQPPEAQHEDSVSTAVHDTASGTSEDPVYSDAALPYAETSPASEGYEEPSQEVPTIARTPKRTEPTASDLAVTQNVRPPKPPPGSLPNVGLAEAPTGLDFSDDPIPPGLDDPPTDPTATENDNSKPWLVDEPTQSSQDFSIEEEAQLGDGFDVLGEDDIVQDLGDDFEELPPDEDTGEMEAPPSLGFDLSPPQAGEQMPVTAPTFDVPISLIEDQNPQIAEELATQVASRLHSEVHDVRDIIGEQNYDEEHRDVDPRPFLESLQHNPQDMAAYAALRKIYTAGNQWMELIGLLLQQSEAVGTQEERRLLLCEMGSIFGKQLDASDKAQVVLISALLLDPMNEDTAAQLTSVTADARLWNTLFAELGQVAAQEAQASRRAALCARLGDWYIQAGHLSFAEPCFQQSLSANPNELRALIGMAVLFEQAEASDKVGEVLAHLPPSPPPGTPVELCLKIAALQERAGNYQGVTAALEEVLHQEPDHEKAQSALESLFGHQNRWSELVALLSRRATKSQDSDPDAAAGLWRRVAKIQFEELEDKRAAEQTCMGILELVKGDEDSLQMLQLLYSREARWRELAWVLERRVEITTKSREKASYLLALGRLEGDEFLEHESAAQRLRQVLELEPRNDEAHERLSDALRKLGNWSELADTLEQHALAARDEVTRAARLVEAANLRTVELSDHKEASSLLRRALQLSPDNPVILGKLGDALEKAGDLRAALEAFRDKGNAEGDPSKQALSLLRAAKIARDQLQDTPEAMDLLERAISIDPACREAVAILRQERLTDGDWEGAARALQVEIDQTQAASRRGKLLIELGEILQNQLARFDKAIEAYEGAREALGDDREVAEPLFELYISAERFRDAAEVGDILARYTSKCDPEAIAAEAVKIAAACGEIEDDERALAHLERAVTAVRGYEPALPQLADLYEKSQSWEQAYRTLSQIPDEGSRSDWVTRQARLGRVARLAGRNNEAKRVFEEILIEQPKHNEALRQVAAISESGGDLAHAIGMLEKVEVDDDELRLGHRNRIVDLAKKADDDTILERALQAVLELEPDDHRCLTMLLELQSRNERWSQVVETIERLAETVAGKPKARAKYFSAAAKIYRDKIGDLENATRMFEKVLDEDWTDLAVFAGLDKLLTEARQYELQERVYRHMIYRVSGKGRTDLEVQLWQALGEIYRSRLGRFEEAAEAFAGASRLQPDNVGLHIMLAELYQALERPAEALARHREILRLQPDRLETLQAMRELYSVAGQYDHAFCLCGSLVGRGVATPDEQKFFQDWLPMHQPLIQAMSSLSDEDWLRQLRHPDEDPYVSGIFDTILSLLLAGRVRPLKEFGLSSETLVDLSQQSSLAQQFLSIVRAFGLRHAPQLHMVRSNPGTMTFALTNPIASIMGAAMTQLAEPQRVFLTARHLAYYQGGRYLAVLCPSRADLQVTLLTAIAAVTGQDGALPAAAQKGVVQLRTSLQRTPPILERLGRLVRKFLAKGGQADFDKWLKGVELTACRAGTLMVADPRVAAAALRHDTSTLASVSPQERLQDILDFTASENYVQLRKILGVRVG